MKYKAEVYTNSGVINLVEFENLSEAVYMSDLLSEHLNIVSVDIKATPLITEINEPHFVKNGKYGILKCSECNGQVIYKTSYCPHCGVKMESVNVKDEVSKVNTLSQKIFDDYGEAIKNKNKQRKEKDITVFIRGDENEKHYTYIGNREVAYQFYSNGYYGIKSKEVISFLKFLGYNPFVMHIDKFYTKKILYADFE